MKVKVGDKVRALVQRSGKREEITTVILAINGQEVLVAYEHGHTGDSDQPAWWIFMDPNRVLSKDQGMGKIICKNWQRFEVKNES